MPLTPLSLILVSPRGFPYEFSAHVPFLLRWPDMASRAAQWKRGITVTDRVVELRDIFPTFLDAAGALRGPGSIVPPGWVDASSHPLGGYVAVVTSYMRGH